MKHLLAAGASKDLADAWGNTPFDLAEMCDHTAAVELLNEWPAQLTLIMKAVVMRNDAKLKRLLHSGEDPHVTVQHQQQTLNALVLATMDENTTCWAAPVCAETLNLIQRSMQWTPEAHQLFPPCFRRGVKHVLGVKVALDAADRGFPQPIWMMIISFLPRDWQTVNADMMRAEDEKRVAMYGEAYSFTEFVEFYKDDAQWYWEQAKPVEVLPTEDEQAKSVEVLPTEDG